MNVFIGLIGAGLAYSLMSIINFLFICFSKREDIKDMIRGYLEVDLICVVVAFAASIIVYIFVGVK